MEDGRYHFIGSVNELQWFFDHVIAKPTQNESYLMCIGARNKNLTEEERLKYVLSRAEMLREQVVDAKRGWCFAKFKEAVLRYEVPHEGLITASYLPYPPKSLVVYFYANPSDEVACSGDTLNYTMKLYTEALMAVVNSNFGQDFIDKIRASTHHQKSCHATNTSRRIWTHFDFDLVDPCLMQRGVEAIRKAANELMGCGSAVIISSANGLHVLVRKDALSKLGAAIKNDPIKHFIQVAVAADDVFSKDDPPKKMQQDFVPLPGTMQYDSHLVTVANKEDFVDD